jgi:hypothetical protein
MNAQLRQMMRLAVLATAAVSAAPASAADGDESFNAMVEMHRFGSTAADEWQNPLMASGTGRYATQSADEVLTAALRIYTRDVLDRGYWVNAWVGDAPGYDSGNPLLAIAPGTGVTLRVAGAGLGDSLSAAPSAQRLSALLATWR